jgi:alpha-glucuronidase
MNPFAALRPLLVVMALAIAAPARAEDGYDLWLRYPPAPAAQAATYRAANTQLVLQGRSPTLDVAAAELARGLSGMTGSPPPLSPAPSRSGAVLLGTSASSPTIAGLSLPLQALGPEGFVVRRISLDRHRVTVIAANSDIGVLYGVFRYLREMQTGRSLAALDIVDAPR